jgi:hypothetical protein
MARRYKFYAAATGTAYQYFFVEQRNVNRPEGQGSGTDYVFAVTADQQPPFVVRVFLSLRAQESWRQAHGRTLDANEMYAVAKMCLFRAFDDLEGLRNAAFSLLVDEANIDDLLDPLDL